MGMNRSKSFSPLVECSPVGFDNSRIALEGMLTLVLLTFESWGSKENVLQAGDFSTLSRQKRDLLLARSDQFVNSFLAYSELSIFSPNSTTRSRIRR